jgi:hypothetical protein
MDFATSTLLACTQPTMTIPFQVTNAMQVPTLNMVMETLSSRLTPKLARIALQVTTVPHPAWHHKCAHQVNTDQTLAEIQLASQSATGTTRSLQRLNSTYVLLVTIALELIESLESAQLVTIQMTAGCPVLNVFQATYAPEV